MAKQTKEDDRSDRFTGTAEDITFDPEPLPGYRIDVDGDGETTATTVDGKWVSGDPSLVGALQARQRETGLVDSQSLASDAVHWLELEDSAMTVVPRKQVI